jgi:peptidoglycan hydrolase CwlO-like protein
MTDNVENLILEHMRSLRAGQDNIAHELREVQARISSLEAAVLGNKREVVFTQEDIARQQVSIDTIKERLFRVERRLELRDDAN